MENYFSESIWEMLLKSRDLHMIYNKFKVAEELYPKACLDGSPEMLKIPLSSPDLFEQAGRCCDETIYGVQGSFRKLEIDWEALVEPDEGRSMSLIWWCSKFNNF